MHLDQEQLQRLLHRELTPSLDARAREHLTGCADCRDRVAAAERDEAAVHALLRLVDHAPPRVEAGTLAARAHSWGSGWGRWAAGILLLLGLAGVAYAAPGSPLRGWVRAAVERVMSRREQAPTALPPQNPDAALAGIAVTPGRQLLILFTAHGAGARARVSLTDSAEVVVRAPVGAATFYSDADRLVIDNKSVPTTFEIQIPRAAPRVEIRVGPDRIFLKDGPRIVIQGSAEAEGPYVLSLAPPGS
jgi:hypothetical protein